MGIVEDAKEKVANFDSGVDVAEIQREQKYSTRNTFCWTEELRAQRRTKCSLAEHRNRAIPKGSKKTAISFRGRNQCSTRNIWRNNSNNDTSRYRWSLPKPLGLFHEEQCDDIYHLNQFVGCIDSYASHLMHIREPRSHITYHFSMLLGRHNPTSHFRPVFPQPISLSPIPATPIMMPTWPSAQFERSLEHRAANRRRLNI